MNREKLFDYLRDVFGSLDQTYVDGVESTLESCAIHGCGRGQTAYLLGTGHLETDGTFNPDIDEYGKGAGKKYGKPAGPYGHIYYGRSIPQVTWLDNYAKLKKIYNVDFVRQPGLVKSVEYAFDIHVRGMMEGWWTTKKLPDYINKDTRNYKDARRTINGTDRWQDIRALSYHYEAALIHAGFDLSDPAPSPPSGGDGSEPNQPEEKPVITNPETEKKWWQSRAVWGGIISLIATMLQVLLNINLTDAIQDQILELVLAMLTGSGGILAIVGRILATKKIV